MKNKKVIINTLLVTLFLDVFGASLLLPLIPALFTDSSSSYFVLSNYSEKHWIVIAGLITSIYGFVQFIVAPIMGDLSDRFGRKVILGLGVLILSLSNLVFSVSLAIGSLSLIIASRVISGCSGATLGVAQAVVSEVVLPHERVKYFGLIGAALSLALIIGPLISGLIVYFTQNPALPFLFAGAIGILNFIFILKFFPETHANVKSHSVNFSLLQSFINVKKAFELKALKTLYGALFLQRIGFTFFTAFIAILLSSKFAFNELLIALFFALAGFSMVIVQTYVLNKLSTYLTDYRLLVIGLPLLAIVLISYSFTESMLVLFILLPFLSLAVASINASFPSLMLKNAHTENSGVVLGINASLFSFSMGFAPLLGGILITQGDIGFIFIVGAILTLIAWSVLVKSSVIQR